MNPQASIIANLISTLPAHEQEELLHYLNSQKTLNPVSEKIVKFQKPSKAQQIVDLALAINKHTKQQLDTAS